MLCYYFKAYFLSKELARQIQTVTCWWALMNIVISIFTLAYTLVLSIAPYTPYKSSDQRTKGTSEVGIKPLKVEKLKPIQAAQFKPVEELAPVAAPAPQPPAQTALNSAPAASSSVCGVYVSQGNSYMDYIFLHESTNNPCAINAGGCIGLGQSCPGGSGLATACPNWRQDVACQIAHFTGYANRYGGWAGSYAFWLANHWW
jgi:hypothetical protein